MTPTMLLAAFTLITVTNQGEVFHAKGFDTLRMCEQAKSVATTGKTLEQIEADHAAWMERYEREQKEFEAQHPRRKATAAEKKQAVKYRALKCEQNLTSMWCEYLDGDEVVTKKSGVITSSGSYASLGSQNSIKHAECVIEPPKP
jgi:hypothetical protein